MSNLPFVNVVATMVYKQHNKHKTSVKLALMRAFSFCIFNKLFKQKLQSHISAHTMFDNSFVCWILFAVLNTY